MAKVQVHHHQTIYFSAFCVNLTSIWGRQSFQKAWHCELREARKYISPSSPRWRSSGWWRCCPGTSCSWWRSGNFHRRTNPSLPSTSPSGGFPRPPRLVVMVVMVVVVLMVMVMDPSSEEVKLWIPTTSHWREAKRSNREEKEKFKILFSSFERRKRNRKFLLPVSRGKREF